MSAFPLRARINPPGSVGQQAAQRPEVEVEVARLEIEVLAEACHCILEVQRPQPELLDVSSDRWPAPIRPMPTPAVSWT